MGGGLELGIKVWTSLLVVNVVHIVAVGTLKFHYLSRYSLIASSLVWN